MHTCLAAPPAEQRRDDRHASPHPRPDRRHRDRARRPAGRCPPRRRRARACARPSQRPRAPRPADRRGILPRDGRAGDARAGRRRARSRGARPRADAGRRRRGRHGVDRRPAGRDLLAGFLGAWRQHRQAGQRQDPARPADRHHPRPAAGHGAGRRRPSHPGRPGFAPLRPCQRHVPQFRPRLGLDPDGGADAGRGLRRPDQLCGPCRLRGHGARPLDHGAGRPGAGQGRDRRGHRQYEPGRRRPAGRSRRPRRSRRRDEDAAFAAARRFLSYLPSNARAERPSTARAPRPSASTMPSSTWCRPRRARSTTCARCWR